MIADISWHPIGPLSKGQAVLDTLESKDFGIYLRRPIFSFRPFSKLTFKSKVNKPNVRELFDRASSSLNNLKCQLDATR